ncbi:MAG: ester cyclase [Solirubrobacteraceae bacterium]
MVPDARIEIDDIIAEGDRVVIHWHSTGTHQGELMGIPASGRSVHTTGIGIDRIVDGKIAESWTNWDTLGLLAQIGALPSPTG